METFPHPTLTPIQGKPTPHDIQRLRRELVANAMAIPSTRGGGEHGHLILILQDDEYYNITNHAFRQPEHPGQPPEHAPNATNAQIHAADTTYQRNITDFTTYINTRNALRAQILVALNENYYSILNDPLFGYATITPRDLLRHLTTTYGKITTKDLETNREALKAPWDPNDDITTLWTRIQNCQNFA
jgi:hypothetical protein